jgi:SEC-C motif-containing protein
MKHECPCQSGNPFVDCCEPLLNNKKIAATAEQLMRSRFVAYSRSDWKYVFKTWHKSTRPSLAELRLADDHPVNWLGLKVVRCEHGLTGDLTGIVEFVATYSDTQTHTFSQLKEVSRFVFENGKWFYLDAE